MKWSKRPESLTEKGEFGPHALPISGHYPRREVVCLLALAGWYNRPPPPTGFSAISHMRSLWNGKLGHSSCFAHMCLFQSISHTQAQCRVSKVQQKTCLLGEQRARAPSVLILSWRIQGDPPRWKVVAEPWKAPGFLASGGEEFNPWPVTRLDHSELLYNKVLLKYKRDREIFWHRHQKGAERVPPC